MAAELLISATPVWLSQSVDDAYPWFAYITGTKTSPKSRYWVVCGIVSVVAEPCPAGNVAANAGLSISLILHDSPPTVCTNECSMEIQAGRLP